MKTRIALSVLLATLVNGGAFAQVPPTPAPLSQRFLDPAAGLSLDEAVARALEQEPSLRATRTQIDVAHGMRLQASLRPNPTVSFERRDEPAGTDNQTMIEVEWPLDLLRRSGRMAVADRELTMVQLAVADRERLLAAEVRTRYGEVLAAIRDLGLLDELAQTTRTQHELLRARVEEGGSPPLERDLLDVELRRLESDRLLQAGRTEAALLELKRVVGMPTEVPLRLRDTLERVVQRDASPVTSGADAGAAVAPSTRADVREAEARIGVAEAKIDRAQREGRLDVSLFGNYMRMDAGFPQFGVTSSGSLERVRGRFQYVTVGAMVTLPLLNRNQGEVAVARAERAGAAAALDAARLTAETEVAAARTRDEHARQAVRLYAAAQTLARQNLSVVAESRGLGRVTIFDVLAEQRRYLEVERAYTDALRAAYDARTALQRALGDRP